ncbi:MAG: hypothetical protein FWF73_07185 [Spirochaetes bacterium]|nr:hypothetical protein [Spirochaetota bacterium]
MSQSHGSMFQNAPDTALYFYYGCNTPFTTFMVLFVVARLPLDVQTPPTNVPCWDVPEDIYRAAPLLAVLRRSIGVVGASFPYTVPFAIRKAPS